MSTCKDIIFANGGAVVVIAIKDCIKEAQLQLHDIDKYQILPQDPTISNKKLGNQAIHHFQIEKLLKNKVLEELKM